MLFNSYLFVLVFLPAVLAVWWLAPWGPRARLAALTAASYLFYGAWDWRFTLLLAGSTVLDYGIGQALWRAPNLTARRGSPPARDTA